MTALVAGAPSAGKQNWNQVDWNWVRAQVYRLQMRIAKAVREGKWNKAKALSHLLTRSFYAKLLAVKQVTSNKGKRTPGIDGILWKGSKQRWQATQRLKNRGYKAQPLRRTYIPKSNGKQRPLGIPSMEDRAMQALYALALKPIAETTGDKHSYGFRAKRSLHDAIKQCFISLATKVAAPWVLDADIKACFDRIDHQWLLDNIPLPKGILSQWLKSGYLENAQFYDTKEGTPQGGIISPILANMALDGLEAVVLKGRDKKRRKLNVIRYADDFVVTGATQALLRDEILPDIKHFLQQRGSSLSEGKTHIRPIGQGFSFLGFYLRKFNGKLITVPDPEKSKSFMQRIKTFLKEMHGVSFDVLLYHLNRKLRGWAMFNRHVVAKRLFNTLDNAVYPLVCHWLRRLHRNKTWAWIKRQYRHYRGGRYSLGTYVQTSQGERQWLGLFNMADVPIRRHVKIRSEANSYNAADREYFRTRRQRQQWQRAKDRRILQLTPFIRGVYYA